MTNLHQKRALRGWNPKNGEPFEITARRLSYLRHAQFVHECMHLIG